MGLADQKCAPCDGSTPPLKGDALRDYHRETPDWNVVDEHHLERIFTFPDFRQALDFVNRIGGIAEEQGHHPDMLLSWGKVDVKIFTHKVNGLTDADFILAAKIDREAGRRTRSAP